MTVLQVLQATTAYFKKHSVENPRLNAEHLLAHVLGRKRIELYLEFERVLTESELAPLREMVPRSETEELVELIESWIENRKSKIEDVGTGSGVIALSLAMKFPEAEILGVDISDDALALAQENAARLNLATRVRFLKSNLLENVEGCFDVIVANLPYISIQDRQSLSREVLHDPEVALFASARGDELVRELIAQAPSQLRPGGMLALEIGIGQGDALFSALAEKNYRDIYSKTDYSGVTRFLFARYG